ncbi:hypothetical protein POTOM_055316 [Populus tomentosa]|nr:hypothetical protein POTOM_055316 [Populus tomentosa]
MQYTAPDRDEFAKQIQELLDANLIEPSKSPHFSPAFLVNKHSEQKRGKRRMVINYKKLNDHTIGDGYLLPRKDELLDQIRGKKLFSSFDCKSGFWQVLLDDSSQSLTAFTCPQGHFQWKVMPFGLKQAPSIFQRHMDETFKGFESFCRVYVDDIIVFSNNDKDHITHVTKVLDRCKEIGVILSLPKAQLFKESINFLGLIIDKGQIKLQSHIAQIRQPLQAKLKKDTVWQWSKEDTNYVDKIKKAINHLPPVHHPGPEEPLIIETDASDKYWGGILKSQPQEGPELICGYVSGTFKPAEQNYHSNEKELLALINTIKRRSLQRIIKDMSRSDIVEEINDLDIKIAKVQRRIQEKQLKLERLTEKRGKLSLKLDTKPLSAEGLLERFSEKMAVAKETGQSSQTPSSPEDLVVLKPKILDQGFQKIESAVKLSNPYSVPEAHKCYVIFSGPSAGVYREWSTVHPLVSGKPYAYQGYKNYELARKAFYDYCTKNNTPLQNVPRLITPVDVIEPKIPRVPTFAEKAKMPANPVVNRAFARFNKIKVTNPDDHEFVSLETFDHYYALAESTCSDEQNHFFVSETKGFRLFNVTIGASPKFVQTLYYCGLLNAAYPSPNLMEISLLPPKVLTAVKHYRQKVLRDPERRVYLSFKSSFLDWEETEDETDSLRNYPAYHYIKMGLLRNQIDVQPCTKTKNPTLNLHQSLPELRAQTLGHVLKKIRTSLFTDSKVRINYQSDHVLMATDSLQSISPEDCKRIEMFEKQFYCNDLAISIATKRKFCAYASEDHKCDFCPEDDKMETCSSNSGEPSEDSCQPGKRREADEM